MKKKIISVILCLCMILPFTLAAHAEEPLNYLLLGDSIAQGFGVYNKDKACYGRIVADTNGYNYNNYGVNGLRTCDLIDQLAAPEVAEAVEEADIISLSIGGNDFLQQNLPRIAVEVLADNYKIVNDIKEIFAENFAVIIGTIKELNPDVVILVQTLYNPMKFVLGDFYGLATVRVNDAINEYLDENPDAFYLVDTAPVMENHPECVAVDTIHPSAVGNEAIARVILEKLCELGLGENTEPVVNAIGIDEIPFTSYIVKFFRGIFIKALGMINVSVA